MVSFDINNSQKNFSLKARRRQTTPDDLLYAGGDEAIPMLNPVIETPDETPIILVRENSAPATVPAVMSMSAPSMSAPVLNGSDSSLMPPPRSLPPKQSSTSRYMNSFKIFKP